MSKEKQFFGTSVIENMLTGGSKEEASPPGSESALSHGLQTMIGMTINGTKKLMSKVIRQQGISPMSILKGLIFRQSIPPRKSK